LECISVNLKRFSTKRAGSGINFFCKWRDALPKLRFAAIVTICALLKLPSAVSKALSPYLAFNRAVDSSPLREVIVRSQRLGRLLASMGKALEPRPREYNC
jgi:hypothetical protein